MTETGAAWCGLLDDEDASQQCAWCLEWFYPENLIQLDYPDDFTHVCPICWRKELAAHPERYGEEDS